MHTLTTVLTNGIGPHTFLRTIYRFSKRKLNWLLKKAVLFNLIYTFRKPIAAPVTSEVEAYYDRETDAYLNTYGNIIQAARPFSDADLLTYFSQSMGIHNGMHLLDAGCGVCGSAVGLAKNNAITVEAITISEVQVVKAKQYVADNQLEHCINVRKADYTNIADLYTAHSFDVVYFLETLGYANNIQAVLTGACRVLKQGGSVYIKDFFLVPVLDDDKKQTQHTYAENIREEYLYRILDLNQLVALLRELGMYVEFIRPMNITEDFTKAALFETVNPSHSIYTKAINVPFQLFESLEIKFQKVYY